MTYIDDAIRLLMLVVESPQLTLQPVNIGNDEERTVLEIAEAFARASDRPYVVEHLPAREGDPQRRKPELTVARSLGWEPKVSLEEGLRATIAWLSDVSLTYV